MTRDLSAEKANREALRQGSGTSLHHRAHALEDAFFAKRERELIEAFQRKLDHERELEDLLQECGIRDTEKGEALFECGIRAATVPALVLTPLVAVAWADGKLEHFEREELVRSALQHRIAPGSKPWKLLESWLSTKPPEALFDAWVEYAKELAGAMPPADRHAFAAEILEMAADITNEARRQHRFDASGGVDEVRVLDRIERIIGEIDRAAIAARGESK